VISNQVISNQVNGSSTLLITSSLITFGDALRLSRDRLAGLTATPSLDAQVLLAHLAGRSRASLLAHPEVHLSSHEFQQLEHALHRLASGFPLPYLLGQWEFYGRSFIITPDVLIPRPETELLIETALGWIGKKTLSQRAQSFRKERQEEIFIKSLRTSREISEKFLGGLCDEDFRIADIGTGSGIIAVTLAAELPAARLTATDLSPAALAVARQNAARHGVVERLTFIQADLFSDLQSSIFDLIVSNLPYIPTATLHGLPIFGREPTLALDGGPDGLRLIERLLAQAVGRLAPRGAMLLEIESSQGESAPQLARQYFPDAGISVLPDLAGHPRLLVIHI